ncbi:MAG: hypothetical protein LC796_02335 [Acidobacteria bacterium]|nr:hypothetical protein [Acidobacteriota bacterium]MCA1610992.1 hypothetical protein [Acidobacteriota bacterium]
MFTILVIAPEGAAEIDGGNPSVEVLRARDSEEALEKLGRNRRVDAVLLLCGTANAQMAREIREDNPAPPPLFTVEGDGDAGPGSRRLPAATAGRVLDTLIGQLSAPAW